MEYSEVPNCEKELSHVQVRKGPTYCISTTSGGDVSSPSETCAWNLGHRWRCLTKRPRITRDTEQPEAERKAEGVPLKAWNKQEFGTQI